MRRRDLLKISPGLLVPKIALARPKHGGGGAGAPPPTQTITAVTLSSNTVVGGAGSANTVIGTATVVLSPSSPSASGIVWSLAGTDASHFVINSSTGVYSVSGSDITPGVYNDVEFVPTNVAYTGSGTHFTKTITATAVATPVAITFNPASPAKVYDTALSGATVNMPTVTMSDSSTFTGTWGIPTNPGGLLVFSGSNLNLTRNLSPADIGTPLFTISALEHSTTITNNLTLNITAPPAGVNFITSVTASTSMNTYGFPLGFAFTVGSSPITVSALGRYKVNSGDNQTHSLYLLDPTIVDPGGKYRVVAGGSASVNIGSATVNTFTYGSVVSPTTLLTGHQYILISTETNGGDHWFDQGCAVTSTADAVVNYPVFVNGPAFNQNVTPNGGGNHAYVPLDFIYSVGATAVATIQGGPGSVAGPIVNNAQALFYPTLTSGGIGTVISGSAVIMNATWVNGGPELSFPGVSVTGQWMRDNEIPISPAITSTGAIISGGHFNGQPGWFTYTLDTTTIPDGAHTVYCRIIDSGTSPALSCYQWGSWGKPFIVSNGSLNIGNQTIWTSQYSIGPRSQVPKPDSVAYNSIPNPVNATYPYPYAVSATATARGGDLTRFRDVTTICAEAINAPRGGEYLGPPQFCTTLPSSGSGGVFVGHQDPLVDAGSNAGAYPYVIRQNYPDGTRLNNQTANISTFVEAPTWLTGAGAWLGCSVEGRFFITDQFGNTTTLAGYTRDRTVLTVDPTNSTDSESDLTRVLIGTFPTDVDLGGATDLVVDPRNDHIVYVLCQNAANWLAKITLTGTSLAGGVTAAVTVYAGLPGAPDAYVEAPGTGATNARFSQPISLVIVGTVSNTAAPNGDPVGTIYIADQGSADPALPNNSAIRRISANGLTVDTLYGGTVGPTLPTGAQVNDYTVITITSMSWSATGGGTGTIVSATPITYVSAIGCSVAFLGVVNSGSAPVNSSDGGPAGSPKFYVNGFTNNTHFTIAMPGTSGVDFNPGLFGGTIQIFSYASDKYSPPGTVSLTGPAGWTAFPGFIRWSSAQHLVLSEFWTDNVRDINLAANTIRRIGTFDNRIQALDPAPGSWLGMDCDYAGVLGPVDDIILAKFQSNASAAHYVWRVGFDSTGFNGGSAYTQGSFSDFGSFPTIGQSSTLLAGAGHYPWAWSFSRTQGRAISTGTANAAPAFHRIMEPGDVVVNIGTSQNIDFAKWTNGNNIWNQGTVTAFPWTARPAFSALWGFWGDGQILGHTWDDLMHNTALGSFASSSPGDAGDIALANYIRAGMGGSVPRPEITGNDMRDLIYFIRRNTLLGSGLVGGPALVVPGADDANVTPPLILTLSAVHNAPVGGFESLTVTWTTDTSCIGCAMAGTSSQLGQPWPTNIPSEIESSYGTSHSVTIAAPNGIKLGASPIYYRVIAKDMAGNCVYSNTLSVA